MTEVQSLKSEVARIAELSTDDLKSELSNAMKLTAQCLIRLAAIVRVLEDRGEDLRELRLGLIGYLRKIACGQVLPDVVAQLQGAPMLLRRVSALPLIDQQKIIGADSVKVVTTENGTTTHRLVPPLAMSRHDIQQVFANDHIRDEAEQVSWLRGRHTQVHHGKSTPVQVDMRRKGIVVSGENVFIARSELLTYLARVTD